MVKLTVADHAREFGSYTYVYPVVSRRSEGVSLGINLNLNRACNWRCVYCQVEGLVRGKPDDIDLGLLENELDHLLNWIINGDFIAKHAPVGLQRLNDICLSGNGEPTLSPQFVEIVKIIAKLRQKYNLTNQIKTILITNGSEVTKPQVTEGLRLININNGEIWFKVDRATSSGVSAANQVTLSMENVKERLLYTAHHCPTYIQTCWFQVNNISPSNEESQAYVEFVVAVKDAILGVLLYSTARNPALPEGQNISSVSYECLAGVANQLHRHGVKVKYYL